MWCSVAATLGVPSRGGNQVPTFAFSAAVSFLGKRDLSIPTLYERTLPCSYNKSFVMSSLEGMIVYGKRGSPALCLGPPPLPPKAPKLFSLFRDTEGWKNKTPASSVDIFRALRKSTHQTLCSGANPRCKSYAQQGMNASTRAYYDG